jgi:hypothetical protein
MLWGRGFREEMKGWLGMFLLLCSFGDMKKIKGDGEIGGGRIMILYKAIFILYNCILKLYKAFRNLYKPIQNLYKAIRKLYKPIQNLYKPIEMLYKPIEMLYFGRSGIKIVPGLRWSTFFYNGIRKYLRCYTLENVGSKTNKLLNLWGMQLYQSSKLW